MEEKKMQLNIALCDDEPTALENMETLCRRILGGEYDLHIVSGTTPEVLTDCREPIQIALLDVQMPGVDGIDTARRLMQRQPGCRIIFVSGFLSSISPVYAVPHFCMILKDHLEKELPEFLTRAAGLAAREAGQTLSVVCGREDVELPVEKLLFLERRGHWTQINLIDGTRYETREKLSQLHSKLGETGFVRCHVSYLVNLRQVQEMEGHALLLRQGDRIPISRPHELEVRDAFFRYLSTSL